MDEKNIIENFLFIKNSESNLSLTKSINTLFHNIIKKISLTYQNYKSFYINKKCIILFSSYYEVQIKNMI